MDSEQDLYVTRNISDFLIHILKHTQSKPTPFTPIQITLYISSIDKYLKKSYDDQTQERKKYF